MEIHYFNRGEAAEYVRGKGLPCTKATLAKLACVGGGPIFRKFGRNVVYLAVDLNDWIAARLSGPKTSTCDEAKSEARATSGISSKTVSEKINMTPMGQTERSP